MRVVFMGTPEFAATILEDLVQQHDVVGVYTRPDAVRGRGKKLVASPVKEVAVRNGLVVRTPRTLRDPAAVAELAALRPDVICVAAYGAILPKDVLDVPSYGCLNVHASLLPRWRGAAPIERAILAGDETAGVCIMRMEEGLDTGDYCICRTAEVENKNAEELTDELANLGSHALLTALVRLASGAQNWTHQDEERVTYAAKVEKGELDAHPGDDPETIGRKVRASSDAHPSHALLAGRRVTLVDVAPLAADDAALSEAGGIVPGDLRLFRKRLIMGCSGGAVEALIVKPEGKQHMEGRSFAAGVQGLKNDGATWEAVDAR